MNILDRYIGQAIISGVSTVLVVLVVLHELFSFVGDAGTIGRADYTTWTAIQYFLLLIPQNIYQLFPLSMLLGTMLGLGRLANSNELVIIRMAGVSLLRIVGSIMKTALVLMFLAMVIGEGFGPPLHQYASKLRIKALHMQVNLNTDYGLWVRDNATYINVKRVESDGRLVGVSLYQFNKNNFVKRQIQAKYAIYNGKEWNLKSVKEIKYNKNSNIVINDFENMKWQSLLDLDTVKTIGVPADVLSIWMMIPMWELNNYIDYLKNNDLEYSKYELVYWTKIFAPLNILAMVLLSVPFVFGSIRKVSMGKQILIGFIVGFTFHISNRLIGQVGLIYDVPVILNALALPLLVIALTAWSYRKIR